MNLTSLGRYSFPTHRHIHTPNFLVFPLLSRQHTSPFVFAQSRSPQMKPKISPPKSPVPHLRSILIRDTLSCFSPTSALPADKSESFILPVNQSQCSSLRVTSGHLIQLENGQKHELIIYWQ